jgi:hypothetical protein
MVITGKKTDSQEACYWITHMAGLQPHQRRESKQHFGGAAKSAKIIKSQTQEHQTFLGRLLPMRLPFG